MERSQSDAATFGFAIAMLSLLHPRPAAIQLGGAPTSMRDEAAQRRADKREGELSDELRERVGLDEQVARDEVGDDGAGSRPLEFEGLPRDRDEKEPVADQRDGPAGPEEREIPLS